MEGQFKNKPKKQLQMGHINVMITLMLMQPIQFVGVLNLEDIFGIIKILVQEILGSQELLGISLVNFNIYIKSKIMINYKHIIEIYQLYVVKLITLKFTW